MSVQLSELDTIYCSSENIVKMFPITFDRPGKYDRVLSEENFVDWFRSVTCNSGNVDKNSLYSYVITEELSSDFANASGSIQDFEFILGGYYVRVHDSGFKDMFEDTLSGYVYALLEEVHPYDSHFRKLANGIDDGTTMKAVSFIIVDDHSDIPELNSNTYKLHILTKIDGRYVVPTDSLRSFTGGSGVDGGEID